MIRLIQNDQLYNNDIRAMLMAYFPGAKIREDVTLDKEDCRFTCELLFAENVTSIKLYGKEIKSDDVLTKSVPGDYRNKESFKNRFKSACYELMVQMTGRELPWGDLTGVRPTKIAMAKLNGGASAESVTEYYMTEYKTSERKAALATRVAANEKRLLDDVDARNDYCLYVGIPFCPSRCLYCSFTSYPIAVYKDRVETYIDRLCTELKEIAGRRENKRLIAIYIGGGTPTSLTAPMIDRLLGCIEETFPMDEVKEFTVEAGRPDSITEDKLRCLKAHGVSRISINPQTMNDDTLKAIGRAHTSEQAVAAFKLARSCGFDNINMDLIAGLPGEDAGSMGHTLAEIHKLAPESITVHSLAIKRAASLKLRLDEFGESIHHDMDKMLDMVQNETERLGMEPYYLYRQKNIGGNLENVGYARSGRECLYNILIMEEITDVIAAGAGGSTKLVYPDENRVERIENCKSVEDYIERFDEMLARKNNI